MNFRKKCIHRGSIYDVLCMTLNVEILLPSLHPSSCQYDISMKRLGNCKYEAFLIIFLGQIPEVQVDVKTPVLANRLVETCSRRFEITLLTSNTLSSVSL